MSWKNEQKAETLCFCTLGRKRPITLKNKGGFMPGVAPEPLVAIWRPRNQALQGEIATPVPSGGEIPCRPRIAHPSTPLCLVVLQCPPIHLPGCLFRFGILFC